MNTLPQLQTFYLHTIVKEISCEKIIFAFRPSRTLKAFLSTSVSMAVSNNNSSIKCTHIRLKTKTFLPFPVGKSWMYDEKHLTVAVS